MRSEDLDLEELGRTIQLLYDGFSSVYSGVGILAPFVPSEGYAAEVAPLYAAAFAARSERVGGRRYSVYYEPGCGTGEVAASVAERNIYSICLELDEDLARKAKERLSTLPSADVVIGDLATFRPRRADVAYAYLLPRGVSAAIDSLRGLRTVVLSLDFPAEGGEEPVAVLGVAHRRIYVYVT
ncbi:MAG: hypothetical protein ABWW70_04780 [Thermoproteota archaeon]